ncbi:MAG: flavodoxin family protein [Steroidobacteraceae bacterium]|jgi:putative NADPH-quinone reductase|nr:flavodoxin family protein [Steroidobacteraceae bacterium]
MTKKNILVIDAHPDPSGDHFVHALAAQYAAAAGAAGHLVQVVRLSELKFPWLRNAGEFAAQPPGMIGSQQQHFSWAQHVVILYPLWLGSMPALLKAYLEQVMRPGFAFAYGKKNALPKKLMIGKSARIVVTMGMPSLFYKLYYRSHSVKSLVRNILGFVGFKPIRVSLIGNVENSKARSRGMAELIAHAKAGT